MNKTLSSKLKCTLASLPTLFLYHTLNKKSSSLAHNSIDSQKAAICLMEPFNSNANGVVLFTQESFDKPTKVKAKFTGLKNNSKHGFHIHQYGDRSDGCNTAGPHFNPTGNSHGGPDNTDRHVGDLGNVHSDENGNGIYERCDNMIHLSGNYSILGRSCVLHQDEDDLGKGNFPDSKTTGHSGKRIACGVIALCDASKQI